MEVFLAFFLGVLVGVLSVIIWAILKASGDESRREEAMEKKCRAIDFSNEDESTGQF